MTTMSAAQGLALLCDANGTVLQVLRADLDLVPAPAAGVALAAMVLPESRGTVAQLFDAVRASGAAYAWELSVQSAGQIRTLHVAAGTSDSGVLVVAALARAMLAEIYAAEAPRLRIRPDAGIGWSAPAEGHTVDIFEELSRINNELVNAQRSLAQAHADQRRLAEENRQLYEAEREARRVADEAVRLRDQLLAGIAHDLRSPLATIHGYAQLLARQARQREAEPTWLLDKLANIETAASKMTGMIGELLTTARLQLGQPVELHLAPTDLVALTTHVVALQQAQTARHRIDVRPAVPTLVGLWDGPRLERVLDNLLSNAIKYSPDGGTISVRLLQEADATRTWAVVTVADQGVGIPAADLPHLFEWFHRGANVTGRIGGIGIGLAGANQLVAQHGGSLTAESREGQGATFTLRLPLG